MFGVRLFVLGLLFDEQVSKGCIILGSSFVGHISGIGLFDLDSRFIGNLWVTLK